MAVAPRNIGPLTLLAIYTDDAQPAAERLQQAARTLGDLKLDEPRTTAGEAQFPGTPLHDVRDAGGRLVAWVRVHDGPQSLPDAMEATPGGADSGDDRLRQSVQKARRCFYLGIVPGGADPFTTVTRALRLGESLLIAAPDGACVDWVLGRALTPVALRQLCRREVGSEAVPSGAARIDEHVAVHQVPSKKGPGQWVHVHGMEKFAAPNLEAFEVADEAAGAVGHFLVLLGDEVVLGEGPELDGVMEVEGGAIRLRPADSVRGSGSKRPACARFKGPSLVVVQEEGVSLEELARRQS